MNAAERGEIRRLFDQQRKLLPPRERIIAAQGLRHSLEQLPEFLTDVRVGGYWAVHGEMPLNLAIAGLASRGQQFWLPVLEPGPSMRFARWATGEPIASNRFGIPEPVDRQSLVEAGQLDLILVPLLAFDRRGYRLGYGGGYYDRVLAERRPPAEGGPLLVGVGYAFQALPQIDPAPWDLRLDYIATDQELIECQPDRHQEHDTP
ncbi:5-formyltetrahydrofolate cyclo-ligase [Frateuria aurantia]